MVKGRRGPEGRATIFTAARRVINKVSAAKIKVKRFSGRKRVGMEAAAWGAVVERENRGNVIWARKVRADRRISIRVGGKRKRWYWFGERATK